MHFCFSFFLELTSPICHYGGASTGQYPYTESMWRSQVETLPFQVVLVVLSRLLPPVGTDRGSPTPPGAWGHSLNTALASTALSRKGIEKRTGRGHMKESGGLDCKRCSSPPLSFDSCIFSILFPSFFKCREWGGRRNGIYLLPICHLRQPSQLTLRMNHPLVLTC